MERIALCGGTFDPFHRGHRSAPLSVSEQFEWNRIVFIPAWRQPFKLDREYSSGFHRFAMAVLATRDDDRLEVSALELERSGISYSVDTAQAFRNENRDAVIDWIIGDDNLALLPEWREVERLFTLVNFVVLQRNEATAVPATFQSRAIEAQQRGRAGSICLARNIRFEVSSTEVRERLRRGESVSELVHDDVAHYIEKNHLYANTGVTN